MHQLPFIRRTKSKKFLFTMSEAYNCWLGVEVTVIFEATRNAETLMAETFLCLEYERKKKKRRISKKRSGRYFCTVTIFSRVTYLLRTGRVSIAQERKAKLQLHVATQVIVGVLEKVRS